MRPNSEQYDMDMDAAHVKPTCILIDLTKAKLDLKRIKCELADAQQKHSDQVLHVSNLIDTYKEADALRQLEMIDATEKEVKRQERLDLICVAACAARQASEQSMVDALTEPLGVTGAHLRADYPPEVREAGKTVPNDPLQGEDRHAPLTYSYDEAPK